MDSTDQIAAGEQKLPAPLAELQDDYDRVIRITDRLDHATVAEERADLATELVRAGSRYEDVLERAVVPDVLGESDNDLLASLASQRTALRETLEYIHQRTKHLAPRNAHAGDPDALEDAIDKAVAQIRRLFDCERGLFTRIERLSSEQRQELEDDVHKTFAACCRASQAGADHGGEAAQQRRHQAGSHLRRRLDHSAPGGRHHRRPTGVGLLIRPDPRQRRTGSGYALATSAR